MDNHLVLAVNEGLAVVPLDDAMGRFHLGRLVIREVAADLFARGPGLGVSTFEPLPDTLGLLLQALHLALPVRLPDRKGDRLGYPPARAP
jgi:hypothetical protein